MPAYDIPESKIVFEIVGPDSPWYHDIYTYLHHNTIPRNLIKPQQ